MFHQMLTENTLLKRLLRSDNIWVNPLFRNPLLWKIPFRMDIYALAKSQYWPREKMVVMQNLRLRSLAIAAAKIPFWNERITKALGQVSSLDTKTLVGLPITTKDELRATFVRQATSADQGTQWSDHTSGSTGKPFQFVHDMHYELRSYGICERMFRTAGTGIGYPVITMRSRRRRGMFLGKSGIFFYLRSYNSLRYRMRALVELASRYPNGVIIQGFSSSLVELARLLEEGRITLPARAVVATGEGISTTQRNNIENSLKTKLYMAYTARELGWLAFECEHRRLHINEEWAYLEIVDKAGIPLPSGVEGHILVTTFDNIAMPFIRYDTGDRGIIEGSTCSCGRTLRTLRLTGRVVELLSLPDGRIVSLLDVSSAFDEYWSAVRQYQIIRTGPLSFRIKIIPGTHFADIKEDLEAKLVRVLHPRAQMEWEIVQIIAESAGGKAVYFVDDQVKTPV